MSPPPASPAQQPRLQLIGITKAYPGVVANSDVSLCVQPGEIHAVLGENGAGKSTLMKIIYGAVKPDAGSLQIDGQAVVVRNPSEARALGISMVFQHFSLFDTLTVAENVWLGLDKRLSLADVVGKIAQTSQAYGLPIAPERPVHTLGVGERQRVEIVRALLTHPKLLILDEPTSVLTPQAVDNLFVTLRQLASQGCSILYISHKLHEIRALCTACTVLRAGKVAGVCDPRQESNASLSRLMIGSEPPALMPRHNAMGAVVLGVKQLSLTSTEPFGVNLSSVSLHVRAGEVVGIAGVSGNGQKELLYALSGEDTRSAPGSVVVNGADIGVVNGVDIGAVNGVDIGAVNGADIEAVNGVDIGAVNGADIGAVDRAVNGAVNGVEIGVNIGVDIKVVNAVDIGPLSPLQRRALGLHFVPEERLGRGAVPQLALARNLLLTRREAVGKGGWLRADRLQRQAEQIIARFNVKCGGPKALARSLSGGNLQKFIMGREIDARPKLMIVSQPTWGVDVGAAAQIRDALLELASQGCAVLVVSEELDELFEICDRLYVMAKGQLSPPLARADASPELVGQWMSGLWDTSAVQTEAADIHPMVGSGSARSVTGASA